MLRKAFAVFVVLALSVGAGRCALAAETPTSVVKATVDKVIDILKDPALKGPAKERERRARIRQAVFEVWDFREMAMRSLGPFWKERTEPQRKEFTDLYADLLERSYINRIEGYSNEKVIYDKESIDDGYATVKSRVITKRREEIPVDYRLINEDGKWKVYDMVIEGVSLVNNYRIQFNKIIRSSSYGELVKKMKGKAESEAFVAPAKEEK